MFGSNRRGRTGGHRLIRRGRAVGLLLAGLLPALAMGGAARAAGAAPGPNSVVGFGGAASVAGHVSNFPGPLAGIAATPDSNGYWVVSGAGQVSPQGSAGYYGSASNVSLHAPVLGMATTPDGGGYWLVAGDGGIFSYGNAAFRGSTGSMRLNQPVEGMAAPSSGDGYWLVAADGGIFAFGSATFYGSTGSIHLNQPIVGMAGTPDGKGYWLVARDGGIFAFGDAAFFGSAGSLQLASPVVGMAATPDGGGYWLVGADGGVFAYGDAVFSGSGAGGPDTAPASGIAARPAGGYWLAFGAEEPVSSFLGQQERLARLGYLPLTWGPGGFTWRWAPPQTLAAAWNPGQDNPIMRGAIQAFQAQMGLTMDGQMSGEEQSALAAAAANPGANANRNGYTYVLANKALPQAMTVWHDGAVITRTLVNMGIAGRPTDDGTFAVYARYRNKIMRGINPNGTPYADPVQFAAYFNGAEAIHYIGRSSWGSPQSLGCIETPYGAASFIFPYLTYGTLVTVTG